MSNTTHKTVATRLSTLIDVAGGQAAFCRKVWPQEVDPVGANKSKVSKWAAGLSGISPDEAEHVAKAFRRRPAWLLFGEPPEMAGVTRTLADLSRDVANYVAAEVDRQIKGDRRVNETWLGHQKGWRHDGPSVLRLAVDREVAHLKNAFRDYDDLEQHIRQGFTNSRSWIDVVIPPGEDWPRRGESARLRRERRLKMKAYLAHWIIMLTKQALVAEAHRRLSEPGSALVYDGSSTGDEKPAPAKTKASPPTKRRKR